MEKVSEGGYFRSNRDAIRKENFGVDKGVLSYDKEELITRIQRAQVKAALESGFNVIVDDMHLRNKYLAEWDKFAQWAGATFIVHTVDTPVDVCVARDSAREKPVSEPVIRDMAAKFLRNGKFAPYVAPPEKVDSAFWEPVEWVLSLPERVIVDLDGTLFDMNGRDPYDSSERLREDVPRRAVLTLVNLLLIHGVKIKFFSGRKAAGREHSVWALKQILPEGFDSRWTLDMRRDDDNRKDDIVKYEMFNRYVRNKFNINFVLDDRDQVVKMWRAIGLDCFQVAEGDF